MPFQKNIRLLYAISLLQGMVFYGSIATLYRQAAGLTIFQITAIESVCLALSLLLEVPWGTVADKIGYRRAMVICCVLYFVSKLIFWQAESFAAFLAERIVLAFVVAGISGVDTSLLFLSAGQEHQQRVFGVYNDCGTAGMLLAAVVYTAFIGKNYRLAALCTVISYGAAAVLSFFIHEVPRKAASDGQGSAPADAPAGVKSFLAALKELCCDKRFLAFLFGCALLSEVHQTITVFLGQLQYVRAGLSAAAIGGIFIVVTLSGLCGRFSARLSALLGEKRLAALCFLGAAAACCTMALTGNAVLSVAGILLLRVGNSLFMPLQLTLQNRRIATQNRATALSVNAVLMDSVAIGTNLVFGKLADASLPAAMAFGGTLCLVGFGLFGAYTKAPGFSARA